MQVDYIAKRSLKGGHTVDTGYTINVSLSKEDRVFKNIGAKSISLSGNTVTTVFRREESFNVSTIIISDTSTPDNADLKEFLDSTISGEVFQCDVNGTLVDCTIDRPYRRRRRGFTDLFVYSFTIRIL